MQTDTVLECWTDGVLLIQQMLKPNCRAPNNWKWRVSLEGRPVPGRPMTVDDLKGLNGGHLTRRVWTEAQIDEELGAWRNEIVGLGPDETARQLYAIDVICTLFKGAQKSGLPYVVQSASLRADTLHSFGRWVDLYKATHRRRDTTFACVEDGLGSLTLV